MTGFESYRLPEVPDYLGFPRACDPYIARILSRTAPPLRFGFVCSTPHCTGSQPESGSDWWSVEASPDHVLQGLQWHRIGPVLYERSNQQGGLERLPRWLRGYLKRSYLRSTAMNLAIEAGLVDLLRAFHDTGITVILLKGTALMRTVYDRVGLRPMLDVDLLVRTEHLKQAVSLMACAGYRPMTARKHFEREHHLQFVRASKGTEGLFVELHWRLSDQPELAELLPLGDLWARAVSAPRSWPNALVFDLCDQTLHATLHLAEHHGIPQLRWLCDLHELSHEIARGGAWQTLARRAVQHDLHLVLAAALQETQRWFGTDIPEDFSLELSGGLPPSRAAVRAFGRCGTPSLAKSELHELRSIRTLHDKMAHVLYLLFPNASFMRRRHRVPRGYPIWPYYVLRLVKGVHTGVRGLLQLSSETEV